MKVCSKCKVEKDEALFFKDRSTKDGLYAYCKECKAAIRACNRQKINETNRKYRAANKEKFAGINAKYNKRKVETLMDGYVVSKILRGTSLKPNNIPICLIEAKRTQIMINRKIKEMTK